MNCQWWPYPHIYIPWLRGHSNIFIYAHGELEQSLTKSVWHIPEVYGVAENSEIKKINKFTF